MTPPPRSRQPRAVPERGRRRGDRPGAWGRPRPPYPQRLDGKARSSAWFFKKNLPTAFGARKGGRGAWRRRAPVAPLRAPCREGARARPHPRGAPASQGRSAAEPRRGTKCRQLSKCLLFLSPWELGARVRPQDARRAAARWRRASPEAWKGRGPPRCPCGSGGRCARPSAGGRAPQPDPSSRDGSRALGLPRGNRGRGYPAPAPAGSSAGRN